MSRLCGRLKIIAPLFYSCEIGAVFIADGTADWPDTLKRPVRLGGGGVLSENQSRLAAAAELMSKFGH